LFWVSDLGAKILDFFVQAMIFSFLLALPMFGFFGDLG
jgi:hypothetical protein